MKIKSIIGMDSGMRYCLPVDLEEVYYKIKNRKGMIRVDAIHVKTEYLNLWDFKDIVDNKRYYTKESILINPIHIISVIPECIDLGED